MRQTLILNQPEAYLSTVYSHSACQRTSQSGTCSEGDLSGPVSQQRLFRPFLGRLALSRFPGRNAKPHLSPNVRLSQSSSNNSTDIPVASNYDTTHEIVSQLTYKFPKFRHSLTGPIPRAPTEEEFLTALYNTEHGLPAVDGPIEVFLEKELSNPHARAKKQARWQANQAAEKSRFEELVAEEMKQLNGRTRREARAEAAFRLRLEKKEKVEQQKKMRWKHRVADVSMIRRARKKAKKEERIRGKLTQLQLENEPNQFIPKSA